MRSWLRRYVEIPMVPFTSHTQPVIFNHLYHLWIGTNLFPGPCTRFSTWIFGLAAAPPPIHQLLPHRPSESIHAHPGSHATARISQLPWHPSTESHLPNRYSNIYIYKHIYIYKYIYLYTNLYIIHHNSIYLSYWFTQSAAGRTVSMWYLSGASLLLITSAQWQSADYKKNLCPSLPYVSICLVKF